MGCSLDIKLDVDGDGAWPDLDQKDVVHIGDGGNIKIAALAGGMTSGRDSVAIRIDLPDGRVVIAETSMRLFLSAAIALRARYGDQGIGWPP